MARRVCFVLLCVCLPHQRNMDIEGMTHGGCYAERAKGDTDNGCSVVVLRVCVCPLFASPKCSVIRFSMAFQRHDMCGFLRKRFVCHFWRHLLILSFLTFVRLAVVSSPDPTLKEGNDFGQKAWSS